MGSQSENKDELTILVTGFGPFREQYPVNPSWEIARGLPSYLPPLRAKDISSRRGAVELPPVRILVRPEPIRVNYKAVREVVPGFWDDEYMGHKIDVAVHIGMAGPQLQYAIERRGHRTGYKSLDVDGEALEDEQEGQHGDDWIWNGLPDELLTNLDLDDVFMRWQSHCPLDLNLRISEDPGRYLCDFIYYSSMAHLEKQNRPRKVVFLHVPAEASEQLVTQGRIVAENLIRSIAESEVSAKKRAEETATASTAV